MSESDLQVAIQAEIPRNVAVMSIEAEGANETKNNEFDEIVDVPHADDCKNSILELEKPPKIIIHSDVLLCPTGAKNSSELGQNVQESSGSEDESSGSLVYKQKKRLTILDSDSENEESIKTAQTKTFSFSDTETQEKSGFDDVDGETTKKLKRARIFDSDSEIEDEQSIKTNSSIALQNEENHSLIQQNRLKDLFDSDTASENEEIEIPTKSRKPPAKPKKPKTTQLTAKQAAKQKIEIQAESQRRTREAHISLPYHKPKSRTITEFLQKRPCLAAAVPVASKIPASIAIKMSAKELELMSKKLEERKKEVEEFYRSESDSEGEDKENVEKGHENVENRAIIGSNLEEIKSNQSETTEVSEGDSGLKQVANSSDVTSDANDTIGLAENKRVLEEVTLNSREVEIKTSTKNKEISEREEVAISSENKKNSEDLLFEISERANQASSENKKNSKHLLLEISEGENQASSDNKKVSEDFLCKISEEDSETSAKNTKASEDWLHKMSEQKNEVSAESKNSEDLLCQMKNQKLPVDCSFSSSEQESEMPTDTCLENKTISEYLSTHPDGAVEENNTVKHLNTLIEKYADAETNAEKQQKSKTKLLLQEKLPKLRPKLSGNPDDVIDLSDGVVRKNEITHLMERFMKHAQPQQHTKNSKIQISVINASQGEIRREVLTVPVEEEEEAPVVCNEKPGAKLKKLREELQSKILQQRAEFWQKKREQASVENEVEDEKDGFEDAILDDEDEEELTESEEEEEEEIDDVIIKEKARKKSAFVDEEAEVSGDDEDNDEEVEDVTENEAEVSDKEEEKVDSATSNKPRRRILTAFEEDSNSCEETGYLDSTISWEDDGPPPHQQQNVNTPARLQTQTKSEIGFLSPIVNLTGLQGINSKFLLDSPVDVSRSPANPEPSPFKDQKWQSQLQKKLFQDTSEPESQVEEQQTQLEPTTQDLKDICSGNFSATAKTQIENEMCVVSEETVKMDEDDENFITQILNEDELEKFKEKFASPVIAQRAVVLSDGDDDEEVVQNNRKRKRLVFSDDEDESEGIVEEEAISLHDEVDYDSEENEIEAEVPRLKPKDFLENEAELSESDWDSEDEDEKDLDELEKEAGDEEKFDEDELRTDLEKIHMRRILDDDNREVKMLQELLFDDGELHGTGRQRQFRWKNIDDNPEEENKNNEEIDVYLDEEEPDEEEWRKRRHEREMYFKKELEKTQKRHTDDENPLQGLTDSQILKLGQAALRKNTPSEKTIEKPAAKQEPFLAALSSKRGSFLSRGDEALARITQMTKVTTDVVVGGAKSTKNVVFHSVQSEETSFVQQIGKKRKGAEGTPKVIKRLRMQTSLVDD